jgi:hypothetical protein
MPSDFPYRSIKEIREGKDYLGFLLRRNYRGENFISFHSFIVFSSGA